MQAKRVCKTCKIPKSLKDFDGSRLECRKCRGQYAIKRYRWRYHNEPGVKDRYNESRIRPATRFSCAKVDANRRSIKWSLSLKQFCRLLELQCVYCGGSTLNVGVGLDRLEPSKGYTLANVQPCCYTCNMIRGSYLSVEEAHVAIKAILKLHKKNGTEYIRQRNNFCKIRI
jgi:hypothetical protein